MQDSRIKFIPTTDWIQILPDEPKLTSGGIHLPDAPSGGPKRYFNGMGTVLAVGPGLPTSSLNHRPIPCKVGDRVLFALKPALHLHKPHDDELVMVQFEDVIAVCVGESPSQIQPLGNKRLPFLANGALTQEPVL